MAGEFFQYLQAHAKEDPSHPAIIDGESCLSYSDFVSQIECFASALSKLNLNSNSKIGLLCLNQKEYLIAFFAALLKGVPVIPFNFLLKPEDLAYIAQDAGIDTLLVDSVFVKPEVAPFFKFFANKILIGPADLEQVGEGTLKWDEFIALGDPSDSQTKHKRGESLPDVILYTSGTTAKPKGVMLTASNLNSNIEQCIHKTGFSKKDIFVVLLPQFHSFGFTVTTLLPSVIGAKTVYMARFNPRKVLELLRTHRPTIILAFPSMYNAILNTNSATADDFQSLRLMGSGG